MGNVFDIVNIKNISSYFKMYEHKYYFTQHIMLVFTEISYNQTTVKTFIYIKIHALIVIYNRIPRKFK